MDAGQQRSHLWLDRPSPFERQLPWGRCTAKTTGNGVTLFLHVFDWPANGELLVPGLRNRSPESRLPADPAGSLLATEAAEEGLLISVPKSAPDAISSTVVVKIKETLRIEWTPIAQRRDGSVHLPASEARLHGNTFQYESGGVLDNIGWWTNPQDWADWEFKVNQPGKFTVTAVIAAPASGSFDLLAGTKPIPCRSPATGSYFDFQSVTLGVIEIPEAGTATLAVRPSTEGWQPMNLKSVTLTQIPSAASN